METMTLLLPTTVLLSRNFGGWVFVRLMLTDETIAKRVANLDQFGWARPDLYHHKRKGLAFFPPKSEQVCIAI